MSHFDRGYYASMGVASRQIAQRDLTSQTRLKLRTRAAAAASSSESAEERLKRLRQELEERERQAKEAATAVPKEPENKDKTQTQEDEYDDADAVPSSSSSDEEDSDDEVKDEKISRLAQGDRALQRELERIQKEKTLREKAGLPTITHNPLLEKSTIQRRWDDDVIFRNQAIKDTETKKEKRIVNDTTHSDVHKAFLKKHIF